MSLAPGTRLGVYEVTAPIGEGGMGQVWRATDTSLGRQVAIKILPDAFAADPDRLARFEREAKTLASLNHPHIAGIYAVEKSAGLHALVMELVEGEDLAQRLKRGPIALDEALPIAKQIADALEAAHEQGIVHRDLKPANVKLRADGTVKVLDFGLAKAMDPAAASSSAASMSPTITTPAMTQAGMILGTAAYMSPEQARGKIVDKRSDVWAFGAVFYEMLAGVRPFDGEDTTEVIAAVVKSTPEWSALPADVPRPVVTLIQRCLEKDRKARVGDIAVARFMLAEPAVLGTSTPVAAVTAPLPRSAASRMLPLISSAAAALFAIAWLITLAPWRVEVPADRPLTRLDVDLGADVSLPAPRAGKSSVAISPDGTRLAYVSGSPTKLFVRRLDQPRAVELPGTQGAHEPFFSADGQWIGFFAGGKLSKISVDGGAPVTLFEDKAGSPGAPRGGSWGDDGTIFVGIGAGSLAEGRELLRIRDRGAPDRVGKVQEGELALISPEVLPGGRAILMAVDNLGMVDRTVIEVMTLSDQRRQILVRGGASPRYVATSAGTGHLLYVVNATMFAMPFDPIALEPRGTAAPVLDDVAANSLTGSGEYDVSRTGTLVYRPGSAVASAMSLQWLGPSGKPVSLLTRAGIVTYVSVSPDGTRIALVIVEGSGSDVWVFDRRREALSRLTFGNAIHRHPRWSPDGRFIAYSAIGGGLRLTRADGAGQPQILTESKAVQYPGAFTPDGRRLAYSENVAQLWVLPLEEQGGQWKPGTPERVSASGFTETWPTFSPDGRWLAYESTESGREEVYVRAFPASSGQGGKWLVSNNGGSEPAWSRNGHELVYRSGDQIMTARYAVNGDTFAAEKPQVWIARTDLAAGSGAGRWDLAADGKGVVAATPVESAKAAADHQVVFLFNFFDELRRRVPVGK